MEKEPDKKPQKAMLSLPENYAQMSDEERKAWAAEASQAILKSFRDQK